MTSMIMRQIVIAISFGIISCGAKQPKICDTFWDTQRPEIEKLFEESSPSEQVAMYICSTSTIHGYIGYEWGRKLALQGESVIPALISYLLKNPQNSSHIRLVFYEMEKYGLLQFCDVDQRVLVDLHDCSSALKNEYRKVDFEVIIGFLTECSGKDDGSGIRHL